MKKKIIIHLQLERRDVVASQTLRAALTKAEQSHPGLSYDIVMGILKKGDLNVNLNESILRLQGGASETDCKSYYHNDPLILFSILYITIFVTHWTFCSQ